MPQIKITQPSQEEKTALNIPENCQSQGPWSVWECEPSSFDWHYDQEETAYVYAGEVTVKTGAESVALKSGDLVVFPQGMDCHWEIHKAIRKVYQFK